MNRRALLILKIVLILLLAAALPAEMAVSRASDQRFELKLILILFTGVPLVLFAGSIVLARHTASVVLILVALALSILWGLRAYFDEIWHRHPVEPPVTWFAVPIFQSIIAVICAVVTLGENGYRKRRSRSEIPAAHK